MKNIIGDSLLLVMILGELQKKLNRQMPDPTYAISFKSWGFKDVKYDIPMCQSYSTRPSPFNSSPQCKKSSLRHHFRRNSWKLGSQKLLAQAHFWCASKFFSSSQCKPLPGAYLGESVPSVESLFSVVTEDNLNNLILDRAMERKEEGRSNLSQVWPSPILPLSAAASSIFP